MRLKDVKKLLDEIKLDYDYVSKNDLIQKLGSEDAEKVFDGEGAILMQIAPRYNIYIFENRMDLAYNYEEDNKMQVTYITISLKDDNEVTFVFKLKNAIKFILTTYKHISNTILVKVSQEVKEDENDKDSILKNFESKIIN